MRRYWWVAALCMGWSAFAAGWATTCLVLDVQPVVNCATLVLNILTFYLTWGWWKPVETPKIHTLDEEVEAELHRFRRENGLLD